MPVGNEDPAGVQSGPSPFLGPGYIARRPARPFLCPGSASHRARLGSRCGGARSVGELTTPLATRPDTSPSPNTSAGASGSATTNHPFRPSSSLPPIRSPPARSPAPARDLDQTSQPRPRPRADGISVLPTRRTARTAPKTRRRKRGPWRRLPGTPFASR